MVPTHQLAVLFCARRNKMPFDPENDRDIKQLKEAITFSRAKLRPFREFRALARRQWTANHYGDAVSDPGSTRIPVNELALLVSVLLPTLAANNPQVLITTRHRDLEPQAAEFEQKINRTVHEIDLVDSLKECLLDAIFCIGLMRVGITEDTRSSNRLDREQIYAEPISLTDFVIDQTARSWKQADFMGNRYVLPLEMVVESGQYEDEFVEKLKKRSLSLTDDGVERDEALGKDSGLGVEYNDKVELWDIWLPETNVIVTLADEGPDTAGRIVAFDGPESGPFHRLAFRDVPGGTMPLSPAMSSMDLHLFVNAVYRKIFRQSERQKEVPWFKGEAAEDMQRLMEAADGQVVKVENENAMGVTKFGGANPQTIAIAMHAVKLFSQHNGNLDVLGGIQSVAGTATQEEQLASQSKGVVQDMQSSFAAFTKKIVQAIGWYEWTDPLRSDFTTKDVGPFRLTQPWNAETREGDFIQYDLDIEPFSMRHQTPSSRLQMLMQLWPMVQGAQQALQAENKIPSMGEFLKIVAKYANLPELNQIIQDFNPETNPEFIRSTAEPQTSAPTQTTNTRISRSAGQDSDDQLMNRMLQTAEVA